VLGPEGRFHGLEPFSVIGEHVPNFTVEELAAKYIADVKKVQPAGPYHIGGHCFGGVVAFEMAQQLRAQGEDVPLLALVDSFVPGEQPDFPIRPLRRTPFWTLDKYMGDLLWRSPKQRFAYIRYLVRCIKLGGRARINGTGPIENRWPALEAANRHANNVYLPKPYPGRVILFWGSDHAIRSFHDRRLGWSEIAEGGLEVFVVPGAPRTFPARLRHSASESPAMVTVDRTDSVSWSEVAKKLRKYLQSSADAFSANPQSNSASTGK
jgi:thioesterase domain-containing protein